MPYKYNVFTRKLDYYQSQLNIVDWQESVLSISTEYGAASASGTNRYVAPSASGTWTADNVYQFNGTDWDETEANEGQAVWVEDEDVLYVYSGASWVKFGSTVDHGNLLGLADDDHTQYTLADGTRAFTGTVSGVSPTEDAHLTTKAYVSDNYIDNTEMTTISGDIIQEVSDNYIDNTEMTTISGDLVSGYTAADSTLSGILSSEIDSDVSTLSGVLSAEIDSDISTFSGTIDHDTIVNNHNLTTDIDHNALTNYSVGEHRTIADSGSGATDLWSAEKIAAEITTISGKLDDHNELNNLDYASAGHTGFQPAGDYVTDTEMTTISGDIIQEVSDNYIDNAEMTTISGDLQTGIDASLLADGTRELSGTWNYGAQTISGTGEIVDTHYEVVYVDAAAMVPCTTSGALAGTNEYDTNNIDLDYFAFSSGVSEERVQFKCPMPEGYDRGTIKAKFYWSSATSSMAGDTVEWGIKVGALSDNDAIDTVLGTPQVISDTLLADNGADLQITDATSPIVVGGTPVLEDILLFEIYRNTDNDNMAEDAWLFGALIQFKVDNAVVAW